MNKIATTVNNTSYVFSADSIIDVYIDIYPPIKLPNNKILHSIPVNCLDHASDFMLAYGDKITLTTSNNNMPLLKVVTPSNNNRFNVNMTTCPMCGAPLLKDLRTGVLRCLNKDCNGQIYNSLTMFLAALGITLQGVNYQIIQSLFAKNKIHSLVDIFMLSYDQIADEVISLSDASVFVQYIHSVRGNVTIKQFLRGLNVPGMTYTTIDQIQDMFTQNNFTILDACQLLDSTFLEMNSNIDWSSWLDFIALPGNKNLVYTLSTILYI